MSETPEEREARLQIARDGFLTTRIGPTGLVPASGGVDGGTPVVEDAPPSLTPVEAASYDALLYIRNGMSRQEVLDAVLIRNNRITRKEAEAIVDQAIQLQERTPDVKSND